MTARLFEFAKSPRLWYTTQEIALKPCKNRVLLNIYQKFVDSYKPWQLLNPCLAQTIISFSIYFVLPKSVALNLN
jgi:hypothetical protein